MTDPEKRINVVYEANPNGAPKIVDSRDLEAITNKQTKSITEKIVGFMFDATAGGVGTALDGANAGGPAQFIKGQFVVVSIGYSYLTYLQEATKNLDDAGLRSHFVATMQTGGELGAAAIGARGGAVVGAWFGSVVPVVGTALGTGAGAVIGGTAFALGYDLPVTKWTPEESWRLSSWIGNIAPKIWQAIGANKSNTLKAVSQQIDPIPPSPLDPAKTHVLQGTSREEVAAQHKVDPSRVAEFEGAAAGGGSKRHFAIVPEGTLPKGMGAKMSGTPQKPHVSSWEHTVQKDDTLWDIARQNKLTVKEVLTMNPQLQDRYSKDASGREHVLIHPGDKISILPRNAAAPGNPLKGASSDPWDMNAGNPFLDSFASAHGTNPYILGEGALARDYYNQQWVGNNAGTAAQHQQLHGKIQQKLKDNHPEMDRHQQVSREGYQTKQSVQPKETSTGHSHVASRPDSNDRAKFKAGAAVVGGAAAAALSVSVPLAAIGPVGWVAIGVIAVFSIFSGWWPVAVDLEGDGLDLVSFKASHTFFDMDDEGHLERTGWVGPKDALLVYDLHLDGRVTSIREISFTKWDSSAKSDMEALRTVFDSNKNGQLDEGDKEFSSFRIWQDKNQDGRVDPGEMTTLADRQIISIGLQHQEVPPASMEENVILAATPVTWKSGKKTKSAYDIALAYSKIGYRVDPKAEGGVSLKWTGGEAKIFESTSMQPANVNFCALGYQGAMGTTGADVLDGSTCTKGLLVDAGAGDDKVTGSPHADWVKLGAGSDQCNLGDGNDVVFVDGEDHLEKVKLGNGHDVMIVTSGSIRLNMRDSEVEVVIAADGDDVIDATGMSQGVTIDAGGGQNTVTGSNFADLVVAHRGSGTMQLGDGDDIAVIGSGVTLDAGAGKDIVFLVSSVGVVWEFTGANVEQVYGTPFNDKLIYRGSTPIIVASLDGDDVVETGDGDDLLDLGRGNDIGRGGRGANVYLFRLGDGQDTVYLAPLEAGKYDWVLMEGLTIFQISLNKEGKDLRIALRISTDSIRVMDYFASAESKLGGIWVGEKEQNAVWVTDLGSTTVGGVTFAPERSWKVAGTQAADMIAGGNLDDLILGMDGNDTLCGWRGNDTLYGGRHSDTTHGWSGDDTYLYARGDGDDLVIDEAFVITNLPSYSLRHSTPHFL